MLSWSITQTRQNCLFFFLVCVKPVLVIGHTYAGSVLPFHLALHSFRLADMANPPAPLESHPLRWKDITPLYISTLPDQAHICILTNTY
jgi:hypothetical protein